jgi:hypothetical protein
MHSLTNDRDAAATCEKPAGSRDHLAVGHSLGDPLLRGVAGLHGGQHAERDQIAVGRRVRDVARAQKYRFREG